MAGIIENIRVMTELLKRYPNLKLLEYDDKESGVHVKGEQHPPQPEKKEVK